MGSKFLEISDSRNNTHMWRMKRERLAHTCYISSLVVHIIIMDVRVSTQRS